MDDDSQLLARYAKTGSEEAFTELVRRHLNLVYSAALRQVGGDGALAEDVAQAVFSDLARKAGRVCRHPVISGWLYTSAHFAAAKAVRGEQRRSAREQEAHIMREQMSVSETGLAWEKLQPVLDAAMHELRPEDRQAVLLRYFENRSYAEVGGSLGLSENTARMRVERALEKLRGQLLKRGVTATATSLGMLLAGNSVTAAPLGLTTTVAAAAVAASAGAGTSAGAFMGFFPSKLWVAAAVGVMGVSSVLVLQHWSLVRLRNANEALVEDARELTELRGENRRLSGLQVDPAELERLRSEREDLPRLRGEVSRLRRVIAEMDQTSTATIPESIVSAPTNIAPPQVSVHSQFITGSTALLIRHGFPSPGTQRVLTSLQVENLVKSLNHQPSVETLSMPSVTVHSGRQALVSLAESVPTSPDGSVASSGPLLDIIPAARAGGSIIDLSFAAYFNKPGGSVASTHSSAQSDPSGRMSAGIQDGQTFVVSLPVQPGTDVPGSSDTLFVVMLTPTLVDPAGNRINAD